MGEENCIAYQDDKLCFLPNCRHHNKLIGENKELVQELDAFYSNYEYVDCIHFSSTDSVVQIDVRRGQIIDKVQKAVQFNQKNRGMDSTKRREKQTLEEIAEKTFVELLPKH